MNLHLSKCHIVENHMSQLNLYLPIVGKPPKCSGENYLFLHHFILYSSSSSTTSPSSFFVQIMSS